MVLRWVALVGILTVLLLWSGVLPNAATADPKPPAADALVTERFQYLPGVPQDKLFDTATGRLYLFDKDDKAWFLFAKEPDAEAVTAPKARRFQYLPVRPQDRLLDSATGRVYLMDSEDRKWFLYVKEPKP